MESQKILRGVRWAGVAVCLVLGASLVAEQNLPQARSMVWVAGILGLHAVQAALFFRVTASFPPHDAFPRRLLWLLFAVSLGPDFNAWIVNVVAVAIIVPRSRQWPWLAAVALGTVVNLTVLLALQLAALPPGQTLPRSDLAVAVVLTVMEVAVWLTLAYQAALLIVSIEDDRRQMVALNAELVGSRLMLAESSRMAERLGIARELHDSLGLHLTTLNLHLEIARHSPPPQRDQEIEQAQFLARLLLAELRETVSSWRRELRTSLPDAIRQLASGIPQVRIEVDIQDDLPPLPSDQAHALLRCTQEAITNSLRHGRSPVIRIAVRAEPGLLVLTVADEGRGCAEIRPGNGLSGILARSREMNGDAEFLSPVGGGFHLRIRVPVVAS